LPVNGIMAVTMQQVEVRPLAVRAVAVLVVPLDQVVSRQE
jgi:hypothetical protein